LDLEDLKALQNQWSQLDLQLLVILSVQLLLYLLQDQSVLFLLINLIYL
jgi:hypothetical protein